MKIDLKDHVILLTVATSGIGVSIVRLFSQTGATIAMHYNENEKKAKSIQEIAGNRSQIFQADLSNPEQAEECFEKVILTYGKIDTLINNAGVYLRSPISEKTNKMAGLLG